MNQQPNAVQTALDTIRNSLLSKEMKHKLADVLPSTIKPEKFAQVAMVAISKNPRLLQADRGSLFTACMEAAQDGLLPNGKHAALVPFNTNVGTKQKPEWKTLVSYMPMVRGVYAVAQRVGAVRLFNARLVFPQDKFRYAYGFEPFVEHEPGLETGVPTHVYAVVVKPDGTRDLEVMTKEQVEEVRARAKEPNSPAWTHHYGEMMKKTVVHRIAKRLDLAPEVQQIIDRLESEYDFDNEEFDTPVQVGDGAAPRAEDFAAAEAAAIDPEDYELFDEVGELVGRHTSRVWVEQFQAMMQAFGNAKSLKRLEAAWTANETTLERMAGEGLTDYLTEVRTYYERWKAALTASPVAQDARKEGPGKEEPEKPSAHPEGAKKTTAEVEDDTFPGDLPSKEQTPPTDAEPDWIKTFRTRLDQVKTEKALDSLTKATFKNPLDALAKSDRPKWEELQYLVDARRAEMKEANQ